jgi:arylsulfatase A-like enzyme
LLTLVLHLWATTVVLAAPNIVVIMTDDQEDTGSMAYMPKTLSLLAKRGITFTNSFVNLPLCAPSSASFLTGQAAHNNGVLSNSVERGDGWDRLSKLEKNALPVWLQAAGYKTALIGKYINGYGKATGSWSELFNRWVGGSDANDRAAVPPGWSLWYASVQESYYDHSISEDGEIITFGRKPSDYATDVLSNRAVRFIKDQARSSEPFFMLVATKAPHGQGAQGVKGPAVASPKYEHDFMDATLPKRVLSNDRPRNNKKNDKWQRGDEKAYRAALQSLRSVDDLVGAVVNALQEAERLDNTVIIYTSDNGFIFGDPGREGKNSPYEGATRFR